MEGKDSGLDESVFEEINEESAYWSGFIYADGCLITPKDRDKTKIKIKLSEKDSEHIDKFMDFCSTNNKKLSHENLGDGISDQRSITITSNIIADKLKSFGILENKVNKSKRIDKLSKNRHFWRGVVDGDGHIGFKPYERISLSGRKGVIEQFKEYCLSFIDSSKKILETVHDNPNHQNLYTYEQTRKKGFEVAKRLYSNSNIYLDRKKNTFDKWVDKENDPNKRQLNITEVKEIKYLLENSNMYQEEIGNKYNVSTTTISYINTGKVHDDIEPNTEFQVSDSDEN